jgi:hypothetical protein
MTTYGKWLLAGCILVLLLLAVIALWSMFFWLSLAVAVLGIIVLAFRLHGGVHIAITQTQLRNAEVAKARAEVEQQRAIADQQRATAAALWNQTKIIPQYAIGMQLDTPEQAALNQVWTWSQQTGTHKTEINLLDGPEAEGPALPTAPDFRAHLREIGPNHFLLGNYLEPETGKSKPLWASLDDIISLVAIGPQGMGKTTLARELGLEQVMYGGDLHVCDYFNDVAAEMRPYFTHCYAESGEIEAYAEQVLFPEMARRETLYRRGERQFPPWLLIVDEWRSLRPDCPTLGKAIEHGFTDWRKLNFRMGLFSVQLERADLGVSKSAVSTVALFNANENLARTWGYGGKEMLEALRALRTAGRGYCVVSGQSLQQYAALIALPNITSAFFREVLLEYRGDIRDRVRSGVVEADRERAQRAWNSLFTPPAAVGAPQLPPLPMKREAAATTAATTGVERPQAPITPIWTRSSSSSKRSKVTREQRKAICRMFQEETQSITAIARAVLGARGGEPFYLVKEVLAEERLLVNEAAEAAEEEQDYEQH